MAFKVLLVEDDNNLREIYEARLQAEGFAILTAKDGEEALVVAKAEKPDLIISDVMMPRISGFEMLDIMRNTDELKYTKVIMLTALGQAEDKTRANSLGADRYLVKSQVTLEDIVKAAHELTDTPQSATAPPPVMPQSPAPPQPPAAVPPAPTAGPVAPPPVMPVQQPPATAVAAPQQPLPQPGVVSAAPLPAPSVAAPEPTLPPAVPIVVPPPVAPVVPVPISSPITPSINLVTPLPALQPVSEPASVISAAPTPTLADPPADPPIPPDAAVPTAASPVRPSFMTNFSSPAAQAIAQPAPVQPAVTSDSAVPVIQSVSAPVPPSDQLKPETTAEEKAEVDAQIENFASTAAPEPEPQKTSSESVSSTQSDSVARSDDAILAGAVSDLTVSAASAAPQTDSPAANTADASEPAEVITDDKASDDDASTASNNSVTIANKKVIRPLNHEEKPNINELLARQQEKEVAEAGFGPVMTTPAPIVPSDAQSPAGLPPKSSNPTPGSAISPDTASSEEPSEQSNTGATAPELPAESTSAVAPSASPAPAASAFDPNSIAL